jgi:ribulose 1,5-bisphosphate carboxylase large subunit-like protein
MTFIEARIRFVATGADGSSITSDEAQRVVNQVRSDALFGTFAELDDSFWRTRMERNPAALSQATLVREEEDPDTKLKRFYFDLRLNSELFPPAQGGIQHLFGILAGDLLQFTLPPIKVKKIQVLELRMPDDWKAAQYVAFREGSSNTIAEIRTQFKLEPGMPLLAYSFKPRVGFRLDSLEQVAGDVLDAGFNIVELDTRFLAQDKQQIEALRQMAQRLADRKRNHVGRFSINLSLPPDLLLPEARALCSQLNPPVVFKIDGGLDGMSGLQAVRRERLKDRNGHAPIITCYPLVRSALALFVPSTEFVDALASSGADIVYPGGRPDIGSMVRSLGRQEELGQVAAVMRYRRLVEQHWPMPSIAGGIYAGQLQAYYELLGPDVAWFLGGGVALHKDGPKAGAALCRKVAVEVASLRARASSKGAGWADDLGGHLPEECEEMYAGRSSLTKEQLKYVSPKEALAIIPDLRPHGAATW